MNHKIIEVRNLYAKYGERTILDNISVDFFQNEVTVILGSSGGGKTTFLKNITRLVEPFSGSVKIFGQEITNMDEDDFNKILKRTGMLFQNGALLNSLTIFDNIGIPLEQHTNLSSSLREKIIQKKINLVQLSHAIHLLPSELSGGMKKRAALARAIVLDPEIVFFDEPSAGLDPITSLYLDQLIIELKNKLGLTLIIVTHELASINRIADRILYLHQGKLIFHGTLPEIKNTKHPEIVKFFRAGG